MSRRTEKARRQKAQQLMSDLHAPKKLSINAKLTILLQTATGTAGWLVFGFGMLVNWFILNNTDMSFYHFWGNKETATATVIQCGETNVEVNERSVTETYYSFTASDGLEYKDLSYATARYHSKGKKLTVEYPEGKPYLSRLRGYTREVFGPFALLFLIIPAIGLSMIWYGVRKGTRALKLIKTGSCTEAFFKSQKATGTQINGQSVYKLHYEFMTEDEKIYFCEHKTHKHYALTNRKKRYQVAYDPRDPSRAVLLESLPGNLRFNNKGKLIGNPTSALGALMTPALCGIPHLVYALYRITG